MKIFFASTPEKDNLDRLDDIAESIYSIGSEEIRNYYTVHVNFVNDTWVIDCDPKDSEIPNIKLSAYVSKTDDIELLKIEPKRIDKFPSSITFNNYSACLDTAQKYINIMDFITALYDFEYEL